VKAKNSRSQCARNPAISGRRAISIEDFISTIQNRRSFSSTSSRARPDRQRQLADAGKSEGAAAARCRAHRHAVSDWRRSGAHGAQRFGLAIPLRQP